MKSGNEHHPLGDPSLTLQLCSWIITIRSLLKGSESNLLIVLAGKLRLRGVRAYSTVTQWVNTTMVRLKLRSNDSQCSLPQLGTEPSQCTKMQTTGQPCLASLQPSFHSTSYAGPEKQQANVVGSPADLGRVKQCYENDKHSLRCGHEGTTPRGCFNAG